MNRVLGTEILSRLISGKKEWWKDVAQKHLSKGRLRRLDDPLLDTKGSSIWHLGKASMSIVQSQISWVP
jgi:hypothetical protein